MTKLRTLLSAVALFGAAAAANAAVVSSTLTQTVTAQDFAFALAAPGYAANTASTLTVRVQGDFNGEPGEFVTVIVEGVNLGTFGWESPGAYNVIDYRVPPNGNFNALDFSLDFILDSATTAAALADGDLDLVLDFNSDVTVNCGWSGPANCAPGVGTAPYAQASLAYQTGNAVPEPGSLALLGLGLAGLAAARRRKA